MKKKLLLLSVLFFSLATFGQTEAFLVDLEVGFLRYRNDSVQFEKPLTVTITTSGFTEIFAIGKSKRYEFGMQIEILRSKLLRPNNCLVSKIYYVKLNNRWQEVMRIDHYQQECRNLSDREKTDLFISGGASTDSPEIFDVRLNDNYYKAR